MRVVKEAIAVNSSGYNKNTHKIKTHDQVGRDAFKLGRNVRMFQRVLMPHSSGVKFITRVRRQAVCKKRWYIGTKKLLEIT